MNVIAQNISMAVNGELVAHPVEPKTSLVDFLRDTLRLYLARRLFS